jgi:hypothetical protein
LSVPTWRATELAIQPAAAAAGGGETADSIWAKRAMLRESSSGRKSSLFRTRFRHKTAGGGGGQMAEICTLTFKVQKGKQNQGRVALS